MGEIEQAQSNTGSSFACRELEAALINARIFANANCWSNLQQYADSYSRTLISVFVKTPLHSTVSLINTKLLAALLRMKALHCIYGSSDIKTLKLNVSEVQVFETTVFKSRNTLSLCGKVQTGVEIKWIVVIDSVPSLCRAEVRFSLSIP